MQALALCTLAVLVSGRQNFVMIGLNPSTPDESLDDPTIRKCIGYARRWGLGGLHMLSLSALRSTDPKNIMAAAEPVGPDNKKRLTGCFAKFSGLHQSCFAHGERIENIKI